jgi:hypothetical protein
VILAVSSLSPLSLSTSVKSCTTSVYTPYRALYSCFYCNNWWRFLLVSAMFYTIRVNFRLSPTDAGVHPPRRPMAMSTPVYMFHNTIGVRMFCGVPVFQTQIFNLVWPEFLKFFDGYISHDTSFCRNYLDSSTLLHFTILHKHSVRTSQKNTFRLRYKDQPINAV